MRRRFLRDDVFARRLSAGFPVDGAGFCQTARVMMVPVMMFPLFFLERIDIWPRCKADDDRYVIAPNSDQHFVKPRIQGMLLRVHDIGRVHVRQHQAIQAVHGAVLSGCAAVSSSPFGSVVMLSRCMR